jgi:ABC-2 type transport system permease protein
MSIPLLICGTLAFMSIGLLAGSIAKTEESATAMANFIVLPMAFLSGSFFSLEGSPPWLRTVSALLPLKYLNDGMLDVMVRGEGPSAAVVPMIPPRVRPGADRHRQPPVPLGQLDGAAPPGGA